MSFIFNWLIWVFIAGVVFYLVDRYGPLYPIFKTVLRVVAVVIAVFLFLALFGITHLPKLLSF